MTEKDALQEDLHKEIIGYLKNAPQDELLGLLRDIAEVRPELIREVIDDIEK